MEHEGESNIICNWYAWNNAQRIGKGTGRLGKKRTSGDHKDSGIIKIGPNTEKSPGVLWRLVTLTREENKAGKNSQGIIIIIVIMIKGDPLGIVQEIELWPNEQMVYAQLSIYPGEWDTQTPLEFWHINGSLNLGLTTRSYNNQQQ